MTKRLTTELLRAGELFGASALGAGITFQVLAQTMLAVPTIVAGLGTALIVICTLGRDNAIRGERQGDVWDAGYKAGRDTAILRAQKASLEQPEVRATLPPELIALHEELNEVLASGAVAASRANSLSLEIVEGLTRLNAKVNEDETELDRLRRIEVQRNEQLKIIAGALSTQGTKEDLDRMFAQMPDKHLTQPEINAEAIGKNYAPDLAELERALGELGPAQG